MWMSCTRVNVWHHEPFSHVVLSGNLFTNYVEVNKDYVKRFCIWIVRECVFKAFDKV